MYVRNKDEVSERGTEAGIRRQMRLQLDHMVPSAGGAVPLLNYQPALYQQATINIPGLAQQSVPIPTRAAGLCSQTEPFQQTLIVCPPSTIQGLQASSKSSSYPVRMENSVPIVPQNQAAQALQLQPSMLTQGSCTPLMVATLHPPSAGIAPQYSLPLGLGGGVGRPTLLEHTATVLQAWPTGTQQILIPSSWQQVPGVAIHSSAHQSTVPESPMETLHSEAAAQQGHSWRNTAQGRSQQERKKVKARRGENRNRGISAVSLLSSSGVPPLSAAWSQPIVISDTPSPAVSIITIHSDTDTEDERKFHPASIGLSQRTNVISCVTVHDSDSSTASPLTPLPRTLNPAGGASSRQAKSLAVVAPSVKTQGTERGAASRGRLDTVNYIKPKRSSNRQPCSSGESMERNRLLPSQSHPLNLSQVQPVVSSSQERSHSDSSLRRQPTFPPVVSSHYNFPEVSGPGLYAYPASTALSSASQAMEQLLSRGHAPHGHSPSAYAAPYTSASSRRDPSGRKDSVSSLLHGLPAAYQHPFAAGSPYVSVTPRAEAYSAYQLSPRRLTQYPYL